MDRGGVFQPGVAPAWGEALTLRARRQAGFRWFYLPCLVGAVGIGVASTLFPLQALVVLLVLLVVAAVWRWPALAAYLVVGLTPLTAGINRGSALPLLRPNEAIDLLVGVALVARGLCRLRSGELPRLRLGAVEVALLLLAVCSSLVPLAWMAVRQQPITSDDLLYALVLWKYLGLYALIRLSVSTAQGVRRCLWISVGAASVVAVLAILQSLGLFGVPRLLADYYAPYGYTDAYSARGSSTLGLPAATADLMIFNLAIVTGFWLRYHRHRLLLAGVAALLIVATLSAGEFSSAIGLLCGLACIIAVTNSARLLKFALPAALLAVLVLQPVITTRLSGFQSVSGLPVSWTGRLQNLDSYFWPQLFSNWNFVLGVRPSARIAVSTQGTGYVWIESGYTWLLWGGGLPLLGSFVFFVAAAAKRGWQAARSNLGAVSIAGTAAFVAVLVVTVMMIFDPHLTYRGSADAMFILLALAVPVRRGSREAPARVIPGHSAEEG
jgi:hypothetical protein